MASAKGCFKTTGLGCLGLVALGVIFVAVMAGLAWKDSGKGGQVERDLSPSVETTSTAGPANLTTTHAGRVVLDLGEGEFYLHPAEPGAGLSARAEFDSEVHEIKESYEMAPDSTWTYHLGMRQTMPGLQALFRNLMGNDTDAVIHVYLPPDVPIELAVTMQRGGGEVELGGLWLRTVDFTVHQGGFALSVDEPFVEPAERFRLHARMGGVQALWLGNASPKVLDVDCGMGGGEINLKGDWRNDCDARFAVRMGGMEVRVPKDMIVEGERELGGLRRADDEVPARTLRVEVSESMGEIELRR